MLCSCVYCEVKTYEDSTKVFSTCKNSMYYKIESVIMLNINIM